MFCKSWTSYTKSTQKVAVVQVFTFSPTPLQTSGFRVKCIIIERCNPSQIDSHALFLSIQQYDPLQACQSPGDWGCRYTYMIAICSCQYQAKGAASGGWSSYHDKHAGQIWLLLQVFSWERDEAASVDVEVEEVCCTCNSQYTTCFSYHKLSSKLCKKVTAVFNVQGLRFVTVGNITSI